MSRRPPACSRARVSHKRLPHGIDVARLKSRRALLDNSNRQQQQLENIAESKIMSDQQELAFTMLTSSKIAQAFELDREPAAVRDRYGRHTVGQSLLLAR